MRALVFIIILVIVALIGAVVTGYVNIRNVRGAPPEVVATRNSVAVKGGQPPAFDIEAGSVKLGTKDTTVKVPTLEVRKPAPTNEAALANNMM